jgi:hypothetical protein
MDVLPTQVHLGKCLPCLAIQALRGHWSPSRPSYFLSFSRPCYHLCDAAFTGIQNYSHRGFHPNFKGMSEQPEKCMARTKYLQAAPQNTMHKAGETEGETPES